MDSRPVSCTRGTLKQIVQLFKSYLNNANSAGNQKLINPFLCMNLICPPGAYDANVEPAKDDVLFTDPNRVIDLVESLFKSLYGVLESKDKKVTNGKPSIPRSQGFELLLARKPPPEAISPQRLGARDIHPDVPTPMPPTEKTALETINSSTASSMKSESRQPQVARDTHAESTGMGLRVTSSPPRRQVNAEGPAWRRSMYAEDPDEELTFDKDASPIHSSEEEEDLKNVKVFNPWTLAKLNAPLRSQKQAESSSDNLATNNQLPTPARRRSDHIGDLSPPLPPPIGNSTLGLPSPAKSSNANEPWSPEPFPYPRKAWGKIHHETNQQHHRSSISSEDQSSPSALDTRVQRPLRDRAPEPSFLPDPDLLAARSRPRDFIPASELPQGTPLSNIPDIAHQQKRKAGARKQQVGNVNTPFKAPVNDTGRVWFDHLESNSRNTKPQRAVDTSIPWDEEGPITDGASPPHRAQQQEEEHPGLAMTMDYESRKSQAMAQRRAVMRQQNRSRASTSEPQQTQIKISSSQQDPLPSSSPHQNRYLSAVRALHHQPLPDSYGDLETEAAGNKATEKMHPRDARAVLIKAMEKNPNKVFSGKNLPLETVVDEVKELVQTLDTGCLENAIPSKGEDLGSSGFEDLQYGEIVLWEKRIRRLVGCMYESGVEGDVGEGVMSEVRKALGRLVERGGDGVGGGGL